MPPSKKPPSSSSSPDLHVSSIPNDTTSSDLMDLFSPFSPIDVTLSLPPVTYAFVHFRSTSTAAFAMADLNGCSLRGKQIKIETARSTKVSNRIWIGGIASIATEKVIRDRFSKFGDMKDFVFVRDRNSAFVEYHTPADATAAKKEMDGKRFSGAELRVDFQRPNQSGTTAKRALLPPREKEGPPSNTLWVGFPTSARIDEQMIHNAMILFGEIERIKAFPGRHYCFVQFRSVDEARRAKEGLQGRLFGDPRIHIMFSKSDFPSGKDTAPLLPGFPGMRSDSVGHLLPPLMPNPYFPQRLDQDEDNWRRPYGIRSNGRPLDDEFDTRETKRSRVYSDEPLRGRMLDDEDVHRGPGGLRVSPDIDYIWRGTITKGGAHVCNARCVPIGEGLDFPLPKTVNCSARTDLDMLAKHYADAIGFDIVFFDPDSEEDVDSYTEFLQYLGLKSRAAVAKFDNGATMFLVPPSKFLTEVLKISGPKRLYGLVLKILQQPMSMVQPRPEATALPPPHYDERQGRSIWPQTDSLPQPHYEEQRHRSIWPQADGLPPPHYVEQRERSVWPQADAHQPPRILEHPEKYIWPPTDARPPPHYEERERSLSQDGYGYIPRDQDPDLRTEYPRNMRESSITSVGDREPQAIHSAPDDNLRNAQTTSQLGISLTPELIATLASLIPSNKQSSAAGNLQIPPNSNSGSSSFPARTVNDSSMFEQGHNQNYRGSGSFYDAQLEKTNSTYHKSQPPQHFEAQQHQQVQEYKPQYTNQPSHVSQYPAYGSMANGLDPSGDSFHGREHGQNLGPNMPQGSYGFYNNHEEIRESGNGVPYNQQVHFQPALANSAPERGLASPTQSSAVNYSVQSHQPPMALNNSVEGPSHETDDKNQRYQSTLQYAAQLLQKIQQEQRGSS